MESAGVGAATGLGGLLGACRLSPVRGGDSDISPDGMPNVASSGPKWRHLARRHAICRQFGAETATCRPAACHMSPVRGGDSDISPDGLPYVASSGRNQRHLARRHAICRQFGAESATSRPTACHMSPVRGGDSDISPSGLPYVASSGRNQRHIARGPPCRPAQKRPHLT